MSLPRVDLASRAIRQASSTPARVQRCVLDCSYRLDLLVQSGLVVEIKSVSAIEPVHEAQILTYMRLGGWQLGLLLNFNVARLKDGICRMIL